MILVYCEDPILCASERVQGIIVEAQYFASLNCNDFAPLNGFKELL